MANLSTLSLITALMAPPDKEEEEEEAFTRGQNTPSERRDPKSHGNIFLIIESWQDIFSQINLKGIIVSFCLMLRGRHRGRRCCLCNCNHVCVYSTCKKLDLTLWRNRAYKICVGTNTLPPKFQVSHTRALRDHFLISKERKIETHKANTRRKLSTLLRVWTFF